MNRDAHLASLKQKHSNLELTIKNANDNHIDELEVVRLKKQKLKLKERIYKLENL